MGMLNLSAFSKTSPTPKEALNLSAFITPEKEQDFQALEHTTLEPQKTELIPQKSFFKGMSEIISSLALPLTEKEKAERQLLPDPLRFAGHTIKEGAAISAMPITIPVKYGLSLALGVKQILTGKKQQPFSIPLVGIIEPYIPSEKTLTESLGASAEVLLSNIGLRVAKEALIPARGLTRAQQAQKIAKEIIESSAVVGGFGAAGAAQENLPISEILKRGLQTAPLGPGFVLGGKAIGEITPLRVERARKFLQPKLGLTTIEEIKPVQEERIARLKQEIQSSDIRAAQRSVLEQRPTIKINTPERIQLRQDIADKLYGMGAPTKNRRADIVIGLPAAGKSGLIVKPLAQQYGSLIIDADIAKPKLNEGGRLLDEVVHTESAFIAEKLVLPKAVLNNDNIVLPLIGKNTQKMQEIIDLLDKKGYEIHLTHITIPPTEAALRAIQRYRENGRFTSPNYVTDKVGLTTEKTYAILKKDKRLKSYAQYSTNIPKGARPLLIDGGGDFKVSDAVLRGAVRSRGELDIGRIERGARSESESRAVVSSSVPQKLLGISERPLVAQPKDILNTMKGEKPVQSIFKPKPTEAILQPTRPGEIHRALHTEVKPITKVFGKTVKAPSIPLHEKIEEREKRLAEVLSQQAELYASKEFPTFELESQYQNFKKLVPIQKLDEIEDVQQLKNKIQAEPNQIDNILYNQEKSNDEVFGLFKARRLQEFFERGLKGQTETEKIELSKDLKKLLKLQKERVLTHRRIKIRALRDYFGLSDADLQKINRRDLRLMDEQEFEQYVMDLEKKATQLVEHTQAKNELMDLIRTKEFRNWDNLRKLGKLPTIENMNTEQLREFAQTLAQYQKGDEFLSLRKIETVDNTDLTGVRTYREARDKLAKELGVEVSQLNNFKVHWFDRFRWDTALAEKNPFYKMLVEGTAKQMLSAEQLYLEFERELNRLANTALSSRKRGIFEKLIPQQKTLRQYLETPMEQKSEAAKALTKEEVDLANFIQSSYEHAFGYLLKVESLYGSRFNNQNYYTHLRRGILETIKEDGIIQTFKELFSKYREDQQVFNILEGATGEILPLEKFFKFSVFRTGELHPTENVIQAVKTYFKIFHRKMALDAVLPKMDIYAHTLDPRQMSKHGLQLDQSLQKFVKEWLNNKKGRRTDFMKIPQGSAPDLALRAIRTFTSLLDLGLNIGVGISTYIGEQVTTFTLLGTTRYARGIARSQTTKGKQIIQDNEAFVGRSPWSELIDPAVGIEERLMRGLFIQFRDAARQANNIFLLGSLTPEEWNKGMISSARLAQIRTELGRYRVVDGAKSIIGSTSAGGIGIQYKTWAIPILHTTLKNLKMLAQSLRPGSEKINPQQLHELYRTITIGAIVMMIGSYVLGEKDDKSFTGQLKNRIYREALTLYGALNPGFILSSPRVLKFIEQLGKNITLILKLETYKTHPGLKGVEGLKRQFTPRAIQQFESPFAKFKIKKSSIKLNMSAFER